jgi:hypothetical protein
VAAGCFKEKRDSLHFAPWHDNLSTTTIHSTGTREKEKKLKKKVAATENSFKEYIKKSRESHCYYISRQRLNALRRG